MAISKRNLYNIGSVLFSASVLLSLGWMWINATPNYTVNSRALSHYRVPDRYLDQTFTTEFNTEGKIDRTFESKRTAHFEDSDTTEALNPISLYLSEESHNQWEITAKTGILLPNNEGIELHSNVEVIRKDGSVSMHTSSLLIKPAKRYARTTKPVTIFTDGDRTDAIGLTADMEKEVYKLLSSVKSSHKPLTQKP